MRDKVVTAVEKPRLLQRCLKAQGQYRTTLETLATMKNPPVVYAKQANIAHGPQTGEQRGGSAFPHFDTSTRAPGRAHGKTESGQTKLLEGDQHGRTQMDAGAAATAAGGHPKVKPWEQSTGPTSPGGKGRVSRNGWTGGTRYLLGRLAQVLRQQRDAPEDCP